MTGNPRRLADYDTGQMGKPLVVAIALYLIEDVGKPLRRYAGLPLKHGVAYDLLIVCSDNEDLPNLGRAPINCHPAKYIAILREQFRQIPT